MWAALAIGSIFLHCTEITAAFIFKAFYQILLVAFFNFIAVSPLIVWFSRKKGGFFTGTGIAFFYGFCGIFAAGRNLTNIYPITAGLGIVRYTDADGTLYESMQGLLVLGAVVLLTCILVLLTPDYDSVMEVRKKKKRKKKSLSPTP